MGRGARNLIAASIALLAGVTLVACAPTGLSPRPLTATPDAASAYRLSGMIAFPERQTLVTGGAVIDRAAVTLFNASNQTVAIGQTNAAGAFTLDPGTGFAPVVGDTYVLDAYKPIAAGGVGADVARLRTVVAWTGSNWTSISGSNIVLNELTTTVAVIQGLQGATLQPQDTLGTVSGASVTSRKSAIADQWGAVSVLVSDLLAKDQDPVARLAFASGRYFIRPGAASVVRLERFDEGTFTDTVLEAAGALQLAGPKPNPSDPGSETAYFQVTNSGNDGVPMVVSDGTHLYTRIWSASYASTTADALKWKKFGSGFNGTTRGAYVATLGTATYAACTSAFYWNGGIYQPSGVANQFLRIDTTTGAQSAVNTTATTIERARGVAGPPQLFTTDGTYVYNVAYGITARTTTDYNGFTVQVLNPATGFSLVRQFTMDTNSYYVDGVLCDGTYLYMIEYNPNARMRRYRLSDGVREAEWTFPQSRSAGSAPYAFDPAANDPLAGVWDNTNRVFWVGNLTNDKIHLLRGGSYTHAGSYLSAPLDSGSGAPHYGRLNWTATTPAGTSLSFKVRSANTLADLASATWYGPTGAGDSYSASGTSLNAVHNKHRYLQVQATLGSTNPDNSPKLQALSVEVLP
ncbi:hypothetical protein J7643_16425 [bacterium]|nr:hypothetical protein [bacterium]